MTSLDGVRIARVSTVPYFIATQLKAQVEQLAAEGADVTIIASAGPELSRIGWRDNLRAVQVEIPRSFSPIRDLKALLALIVVFRRNRFQIVHSTTPKAGLLCAIAGVVCGVPIRLHTFTGQPWVTLTGPMAWAARSADTLICRLNTLCFADSPGQRQFLVDEGIGEPAKISVLGAGSIAGVDHTRFDRSRFSEQERQTVRSQLGISEQSKVVLFLGRICRDKGIAELLDAFQLALDKGLDADLLLVGPMDARGDGDDDLVPSSIAGRLRVHHVGYTDTPERYLAVSDLLCLPSYREGFGTVIIEAAAMGVPTLGTDIYGVRDAIADNLTGVLVPPKNVAALAGELVRLLSSPEILATMGREAHRRSLANFDADLVNSKLVEEYRRMLSLK